MRFLIKTSPEIEITDADGKCGDDKKHVAFTL